MSLVFPNDIANLVISLTLVKLLGFMKERLVTLSSENSQMTLHSYTSLTCFVRASNTHSTDTTNNGGNSNNVTPPTTILRR